MTAILEGMVDQQVEVITNDGRSIVGKMRGYDQHINIILDKCHERVFSMSGVERVDLGLYVIRGDNMYEQPVLICALVGEVNEQLDKGIDFSKIRAEPLKPVNH